MNNENHISESGSPLATLPAAMNPRHGSREAMPSASDIETALAAFTLASHKVEDYYRKLETEIQRLTGDLERKNAELQRKVNESDRARAMLNSTLQSLTCGVMAIDTNGCIVTANPAACEILCRSGAELTGAPIAETLGRLAPSRGAAGEGAGREQASPRELIEILSAREKETAHGGSAGEIKRETTTVVEWRYLANGHRGRTLRLSVVRAAPPYDLHLAGLILVEDVTELRRLEHQTMVRSRLSGIGEMALSLAHEIRNPLGSISLFATSLAHELEADSSLGQLASHLVSGVRALEHVVSNVLDFARPRRFSMTQVDLAEVISETLIFIEHPRAQKSVSLSVDIEPWKEGAGTDVSARNGGTERALIAGDAERLRQVFLNIALNALQAVSEGGSLSVALRRGKPKDSWEVEFSDDGVGIAPQDLERVFDPLFTTKENGSGLGLAIAHRILTAHGAQIEVDSRPGEGTTFRILFSSNFSPMEARTA